MSNFLSDQRRFNELIFARRNKSYGAYVLRTTYDHTMCRVLGGIILGTFFLGFISWWNAPVVTPGTEDIGQIIPPEVIHSITVDLKPADDARDAGPEKKPARGATASVTALRINDTDSIAAQDSVPIVRRENGAATDSSAAMVFENGGSGTGTITGVHIPDSIHENYQVDALPEFEGGISALRKFISAHVQYPGGQAQQGIEGMVRVRFVVDEQGHISQVRAIQSAGPEFDQEATRVVALLPKFKSPGMSKGKAVKVYFDLPIRFRLKS